MKLYLVIFITILLTFFSKGVIAQTNAVHGITVGYTFSPYKISNYNFQDLRSESSTYRQPYYYLGTIFYSLHVNKSHISVGPRLFKINEYEKSIGAAFSYKYNIKNLPKAKISAGFSVFHDHYSFMAPYLPLPSYSPTIGILREKNYATFISGQCEKLLTPSLLLSIELGLGVSTQASHFYLENEVNHKPVIVSINETKLFSNINPIGVTSLSLTYLFGQKKD